jgi:hypothetical protein
LEGAGAKAQVGRAEVGLGERPGWGEGVGYRGCIWYCQKAVEEAADEEKEVLRRSRGWVRSMLKSCEARGLGMSGFGRMYGEVDGAFGGRQDN